MTANCGETASNFDPNSSESRKRGPYGVVTEIQNARDELCQAMSDVTALLGRTDLSVTDQLRKVGQMATHIYKIDTHLQIAVERYEEYYRRNETQAELPHISGIGGRGDAK